ncbi:ftsK/SpoIIIE family protein [Candidatus Endolissoclinum faulkneri L2]|uniref:DNA translocase FtsK n=1 Tax=Candidatus Endolissoclinum faulkneri L2 TaxID=1193729 RepID=K7YL97_9PROT|nr:DNA translocase FtsK 4TM domain-containing protein [Candidatus Endolissoclinum faulkneri]AFX98262.1 ftsK/SpoIIIE family protein [Candidatus Endolissoclinum faulkneri L2]
MARASCSHQKSTILRVKLVRYLRRRGEEACGLTLIVVAGILAIIIGGYNNASSLLNNNNRNNKIYQHFDYASALIADLLLQSLGVASAGLIIIPLIWGCRIFQHKQISSYILRIVFLFLSILFTAAACAAITPPKAWLLHYGLGGRLGLIVLSSSIVLISYFTPIDELLPIVVVYSLLALFFGISSIGINFLKAKRRIIYLFSYTFLTIFRAITRRKNTDPCLEIHHKKRFTSKVDDYLNKDNGSFCKEERGEFELPRRMDHISKSNHKYFPRFKKMLNIFSIYKLKQRQFSGNIHKENVSPQTSLLNDRSKFIKKEEENSLTNSIRLLESVLSDFGIKGTISKVRYGPFVNLYEFEPAPGTKLSRVIRLSDDIARYMSAVSVRVAVITGRNVIGIEIPNPQRKTVYFRDVIESSAMKSSAHKLAIALGKDIGGAPIVVDLASMPHLLIAGTTGSGKSMAIRTMILSLLYRLSPERCRLIMIDPKMLELLVYDGIPHLLSPVVTESNKAIVALKWTIREMENRYVIMSKLGVRNIEGYNALIADAIKKDYSLKPSSQARLVIDRNNPLFEKEISDLVALPYIVVVIDEVADLMMIAGKAIEGAVQRLAQMARAAGIHVIMATQRPSVDVITGIIKANFPARISFRVASKIDSRTILGESGAEQLLGMGDMLYMSCGGRITRVHSPFCSDKEVKDIVRQIKRNVGSPKYEKTIINEYNLLSNGSELFEDREANCSLEDKLYSQAVDIVLRDGKVSNSLIQRQLNIGYRRATALIKCMEYKGVVSEANHVGKRQVLVDKSLLY